MTKSTKGPLFAEVHNVPDDYHFTEEELDRIIAGDMFTPRQGAIMARELQERRKAAMDSEPVAYIIQDRYEREGGVEGHLSRSHVSKYVSQEDINEHEIICTPLFKAPSLTHSIPDEWTFQNTQRYREDTGRQDAWPAMWGWNACRAAMLQAEPVTMANKLGNSPAQSPIDHGYRPGCECSGCKTTVRICAELAGWIPVSERMPEADGNYWGWWSESKRQGPVWFIKSDLQAQFQSSEITHWMPLPAAPQEVVNGQD